MTISRGDNFRLLKARSGRPTGGSHLIRFFIIAHRILTRRRIPYKPEIRQKIRESRYCLWSRTIRYKTRRYDSNTSQLKVSTPEDKLVRLNVNKVPSRKRRKSYELRLDGVLDTYARTVSVINDYNVRRGPFVFLSRVCKKGLSPS